MKFTKMQGAGNDFAIIEAGNGQADWSRLARDICDRHYGIGADGLVVLLPSAVADCQMRIFNADGSEADACGNGLRCLVKYCVDNGLTNSGTPELAVETAAGVRKAVVYNLAGEERKIQIGMGQPAFRAVDIPVALEQGARNIVDIKSMINFSVTLDGRELTLNAVSMGNPHAVYFTQEPVADFPLAALGPVVERHPVFPVGVNFGVVRRLEGGLMEARVWERGVGETLACGSGACAIAVAARLHGYVGNRADIRLPGGRLEVDWDGTGEVFLSGPTETVFTGEWPD